MKTENVSLTLESLRSSVPAIFATQPAPGVSDHYSFVPTLRVLSPMLAEGWTIHRASQQGNRMHTPSPYGAHQVVLRHESLPTSGEGTAEIWLFNSHDRSRRLFFGCGFFRLVCSNGLVAMTGGLAQTKMLHLDTVIKIDELMDAVNNVSKKAPLMMKRVAEFKKVSLSPARQTEFATEALKARYCGYPPTVSTEAVLGARRKLDEGDNLWLVFNRVQENIMKGCIDGKHTSKPLASLTEQTRVNTKLWAL
ncbi:MAG TPA: DUF932 domain-containing protein, partial [Nitrospira sp.]|nr:DUF932 domain-containing protein [Nitrospira sp.]